GGGGGSGVLKYIGVLTKLVNSPVLVADEKDIVGECGVDWASLCASSGKISLLMDLLAEVKAATQEKIVVVSNWTQTLDVIEKLCTEKEYSYLRLDGSTPVQKRQEYVDQFNSSNRHFLFLLSSKAGGVGLNLVGASRLVLFDIDWNPALDQQAMARVWRDGQRKEVKIYRFLTTGTIEEKIYQRQITKIGLSDALMDDKDAAAVNSFTASELRDLFTLDERTACLTHELLRCRCQDTNGAENEVPIGKQKQQVDTKMKLDSLNEWTHVPVPASPEEMSGLDDALRSVVSRNDGQCDGTVSFVFHRTVQSADEGRTA
ncbi:DNA repair and recombination protein rad54b, partial [Rhizophlyctis rosea]